MKMTITRLLLCLIPISFMLASCADDDLLSVDSKDAETEGAASTTVTTESQLRSAVANASPGDEIKISGTIYLTQTLQLLNSGTSSSKINFYGVNGGTLDCKNQSAGWGVKCNGSYWNIQHLTIKNAPDCGLVFQHGGNNYVNKVNFYGNGDSGLQIYNGSYNNWIQFCNSNENYDAGNGGENADGFACKLSGGAGNVFYKCNGNHNSDDGWDLYGQPYTVKIYNCKAERNGYGSNGDGNGFKLGSAGQNVTHYARNCVSNNNLAWGYDGNGNSGHMYMENSNGSGNGKGLFARIY
ncbi:MAG: right-handed parallel beta-helix repeat-containing protein [Reichenbachiella sp.]